MNTINPQVAPAGVQRNQMREAARTDSTENSQASAPKTTGFSTVPSQQPAISITGEESKQLVAAVAKLNDYVQSVERDLRFSLDEASGQPVITVIDRETSKIIRQIPPEITLNLIRQLNSDEPLFLFSAQV